MLFTDLARMAMESFLPVEKSLDCARDDMAKRLQWTAGLASQKK